MLRSVLPLFCGLLFSVGCLGQARITNIQTQITATNALIITYDIEGNRVNDSIYFEISNRSIGTFAPSLEHMQGDVGRNVPPGRNRRIYWNAADNGFSLDETFSVTVRSKLVKPLPPGQPAPAPAPSRPDVARPGQNVPQQTSPARPDARFPAGTRPDAARPSAPSSLTNVAPGRRPGGPGFALLSLLAPGVGNIFVQTPTPRVGFRPVVTIASYGLLAYGLTARRESQEQYRLYEQQRNATDAEPYYTRANDLHRQYYLATRAAGLIWVTDVALTLLKGLRNQRTYRAMQQRGLSWQLDYRPVSSTTGAGVPTAVVRYQF